MEFAGDIIGMVGTIASIAALWIIFQNNSTAVRLNRSERFKNAVEQLGSGKNPVVLGAIYSLHRIAGEDETYRENVFSILCAYVRDTSSQPEYQGAHTERPSEPVQPEYQGAHAKRPSEPVQAVLNLLCVQPKDRVIYQKAPQNFYVKLWAFTKKYLPLGKDKEPEQNAGPWLKINFERSFLRGANLSGADLKKALLSGVNLDGAKLSGAYLEEAKLFYAHLKEAVLFEAHLEGAKLFYAQLQGANLYKAHLEGADLDKAHLERAFLIGTHLEGASLINANLQGAVLSHANLQATYLFNANLQGANLENANLQGVDSLSDLSSDFEETILSRIGKQTDLSGINGFDPQKPPYLGKPIMGTLSQAMAEDIINKRRRDLDKKTPEKINGQKP